MARLDDPRQEDMFWWSYEVTRLASAGADPYTASFWDEAFEVEDASSGVRVVGVFAGNVQPRAERERVWLRGFRPIPQHATPSTGWLRRLRALLRRSLPGSR